MSGYGTGLEDIGSGIADLFGMQGSNEGAKAYKQAASIAQSNEAITNRSTAIQQFQENQTITKAIGTEQAGVAGAGFTNDGSAADLLRSSQQQAALSKQLIANQGEITAQGFASQASAYEGQASAASAAAKGQGVGGLLGVAAGVFSMFSDRELKENIILVGQSRGFNLYSFNFKGSIVKHVGAMADEVEQQMPEAITIDGPTGFKRVNYDMLGLQGVH